MRRCPFIPAKARTNRHRIAGSTVLEMVVAMVIIVMVLGIALTIFANVTRSSLSAQKLRAQMAAGQVLSKLEQAPDTAGTDSLLPAGWRLLKEVKAYSGTGRLQVIHLVILGEGQDTLAQLRKVIITKDNVSNDNSNIAKAGGQP